LKCQAEYERVRYALAESLDPFSKNDANILNTFVLLFRIFKKLQKLSKKILVKYVNVFIDKL